MAHIFSIRFLFMETAIFALAFCVLASAIGGVLLLRKNNGGNGKLMEQAINTLSAEKEEKERIIASQTEEIRSLTAERDVERTKAEHARKDIEELEKRHKSSIEESNALLTKREAELRLFYEKQLEELRVAYDRQMAEVKENNEKHLAEVKENNERQLLSMKEMSKKQLEDQMALIQEQMKTTSETVLKARQEELGAQNREQVSKIVSPLQRSLKDMEEALTRTKEQQKEALTRLDETIRQSMEKSASLGETADRLTRALTGEVKVQGNFGELKLKQLLEDLELKEGEQFDTQETLRDSLGKGLRGDDGKGMIPDFILHFPNNRHVVVDSKMSLTDYTRYMNAEDGSEEKAAFLKAHIESVRAQVKRLAKKEYTRYLPEGYNKLNFAIMYIPIEGAMNLAIMNDATLWREAYDMGVMILGPQTMYMNLRVLEMMWTQVRQLTNQQAIMDAANTIIDRVQDFGMRFMDVEASMNDTVKKITRLKITTADSGPSIITAARNLLKAGARENKKKRSLAEMDNTMFIDSEEGTKETDSHE